MRNRQNSINLILFTGLPLYLGSHASAGLFSSVSYNHEVSISNTLTTVIQRFVGTDFPTTKTQTATDGAANSTTYTILDDGTSASFTFHSQATFTDFHQAVQEDYFPTPTTFTFLQPVNYLATFRDSEVGAFSAAGQFSMSAHGATIFEGDIGGNGNQVDSGVFDAGVTYSLEEFWSVANPTTDRGYSKSGSATEDLSLTFTAIPEPSSAVLLLTVSSVGLLSRKRSPVAGAPRSKYPAKRRRKS